MLDTPNKKVKGLYLNGYMTKVVYDDGTLSGGLHHRTMSEAERYAKLISKRLTLPLTRITENS